MDDMTRQIHLVVLGLRILYHCGIQPITHLGHTNETHCLISIRLLLYPCTPCLCTCQALQHCQTVVLSVQDLQGQQTIIEELLQKLKCDKPGLRQASATLLHVYCSKTTISYTDFVPQLLRALIQSFNDTETGVLEKSWEALNAVTKVR